MEERFLSQDGTAKEEMREMLILTETIMYFGEGRLLLRKKIQASSLFRKRNQPL